MNENIVSFESLATGKYFIPRQGTYKVDVTLSTNTSSVVVAHGISLDKATAQLCPSDTSLNIKIDPIPDPDTKGYYIQYIWIFTFLAPLHYSGSSSLVFGNKSGEDDRDVVKVDVVGTKTSQGSPLVYGKIPKTGIVSSGWTSDHIKKGVGKLAPGSTWRTITVDHAQASTSRIETSAVVIFYDPENGQIHGVWDGDKYKTPISYPIADSDSWELFTIVKGKTDAKWGDMSAVFDFSVGDPRKEASVAVEGM